MSPGNPFNFICGSKAKVTRHKKLVYVSIHTECNIDACCMYKLHWVLPEAAAAADHQFLHAWSFLS